MPLTKEQKQLVKELIENHQINLQDLAGFVEQMQKKESMKEESMLENVLENLSLNESEENEQKSNSSNQSFSNLYDKNITVRRKNNNFHNDDFYVDEDDLDLEVDNEDEFEEDQQEEEKKVKSDDESSDQIINEQRHSQESSQSKDSGNSNEKSNSSTDTTIKSPSNKPKTKSRYSLGSKTFATPDERGRTAAGPQVEHALAYVVYETIAKKAIAGQNLSEAAGKMMEVFSCFPIEEEKMKEMQNRAEAITAEAMKFRTTKRSLRKQKDNDQNFLSDVNNEEKIEDFKVVNEALKISARTHYAKLIASSMDICIFGANKMPNVSYPTEGVPANPNTGNEQKAKNNLLLLNKFLEKMGEIYFLRAENKNDEEEKIKNLTGDKEFLKKLKKEWGITEDTVNQLIDFNQEDQRDLEEKLGDILSEEMKEKITTHMGELFYYPSLQQTYNYQINGRTDDWAVSKEEWCDVMKTDPQTEKRIQGKTPKYNKGTLPRSNNLNEMYQTVAQAEVAFSKLLPGFQYFGAEKYEEIMDGFLMNSVIRNSGLNRDRGWGEIVKEGKQITDESVLNIVKEKIKDCAEISFEPREISYMKDSYMYEDIKSRDITKQQQNIK